MSYQVIARKWRPQIFDEVIGQESVTQTLRNAITHDRLHHAYIFSGARGVGKTTTARLLAKALNCHKTDKANPTPCNTSTEDACPSCIEISESRSLDVLEFDAASNTQVDKIREIIIENIQVNAARDRYKVFIIDEVHMLSKSSFNALLKTLEEPPSNVVFVMATTELHKVPDTILSRVQEFEFRTIPLQKIINRLKTISDAEGINISDEGLKNIARSGEGSMRDAQSSFDQVISFSGEKIDTEDVIKALGIASAENLTRTVQAVSKKNPTEILKVVDDLIGRGQDLRHFCTDLLTFIRDMLVYKTAGDAHNLLDTAILSYEDLSKYAEPFTESDLIRFFNSLAETESNLRTANEPRYLLEIGLIKLVEMRKVQPVEQLLERLSKLEKVLTNSEIKLDSSQKASKKPIVEGTTEKKNLKPDFSIDEVPFPTTNSEKSKENEVKSNTTKETPEKVEQNTIDNSVSPDDFPPNYIEPDHFEEDIPPLNDNLTKQESDINQPSKSIINVDAMPLKIEPIDSEYLDHIDDKWLDQTYDYKLQHAGDNLKAIPNAANVIKTLLNQNSEARVTKEVRPETETIGRIKNSVSNNSNKALDIVSEMTTYEEIDETIPELPANPTEEELFNYAQNHPSVKKVLKIFRGNLVKVNKKEVKSGK